MKKIRNNLIIVLLALLISIVFFYFKGDLDFFSASILSLQDAEIMKKNSWDIGYKNENNILDVFLSEDVKNINYLSISIIYDDLNLSLNIDKISTQLNYEIISDMSGNLLLKFYDFSGFDYGQSLFELPFVNSSEVSILIGEGVVVLNNGESKNLSVGFLNSIVDDYH